MAPMLDGRSRPSTTRSTRASSLAATSPEQLEELKKEGIEPIDIVVVNVQPFGAEIGRALVGIDRAIEMIDVGGAALLGAAARNPAGVAAVSSPDHYPRILVELKEHGHVSPELRAQMAAEAFGMVAAYHAEIAAYLNQLSGTNYPKRLAMVLEKVSDLRYGENPHQTRRVLPRDDPPIGRPSPTRRPPGRDAVVQQPPRPRRRLPLASDYTTPTVVIAKHTDPVGIASADELVEAYRRALETDPVTSFGAIVGVNRQLDGATAREIAANSYEAVDRAGLRRLGHRDPPPQARPRAAARPARPDRGHARLRHRQARLQARRRRTARRDARRSRADGASSRSSRSAARRSRS